MPPVDTSGTGSGAVHAAADALPSSSSSSTSTLPSSSSAAAAAHAALTLLLSEDPLLSELHLTSYKTSAGHGDDPNEEAAFSYAAALLHDESSGWMSGTGDVQKRATEALAEVDRKLALVEGLAERVARDNPEAVAGPLLRLHGHGGSLPFLADPSSGGAGATRDRRRGEGEDDDDDEDGSASSTHGSSSLIAIREKCDRLERQGELLEGVARRAESSLTKHLRRMEASTTRLSRVLQLSSTLKMAMRLRFEAKKIQGCGIDFGAIAGRDGGSSSGFGGGGRRQQAKADVDLRDLTRAASSVATMEALLDDPELYGGSGGTEYIQVVEQMRPEVETAALAVRRAAAGLLSEQQQPQGMSSSKLGATLQVYFHLGELPQAAWSAVSQGLAAAEKAASVFFNPASLQRLRDSAVADARSALDSSGASVVSGATSVGPSSVHQGGGGAGHGGGGRKKKHGSEAQLERITRKKLKERRAEAAERWAAAVGDAALKVSNLHRVLARKSDPTTRQNFLEVVAAASVPEKFQQAEAFLAEERRRGGNRYVGGKSSMFNLFWVQMCIALGARVQRLLKYDGGSIAGDVAALYPAVRAAALNMLGDLNDSMSSGLEAGDDPTGASSSCGIMGGSAILDDSLTLGSWGGGRSNDIVRSRKGVSGAGDVDPAEGVGFVAGADSWTRDPSPSHPAEKSSILGSGGRRGGTGAPLSSPTPSSSSAFGFEWRILQGEDNIGLHPLQVAFLEASSERLCSTLEHMFPEEIAVDENGVALPVLPALPSRYDLAKLEGSIREELAIADPRQGGGELGMATMICENIVDMVSRFCSAANNATSGATDEAHPGASYLHKNDLSATESLSHDLKLAGVISALSLAVKNAPDNTFLAPYRPAQSPQHDEAARVCDMALLPARNGMESLVKKSILNPLSRALNERISAALAKMHLGTYLDGACQNDSGSFVQTHLTSLYEGIASNHLEKLPSEYASVVASNVATYSIYAFVSNAALVRPLGEMGRLRITQDLADFELALEQLVLKGGNATHLEHIEGGKPYAELRAARQMLFWTGLEDAALVPSDIAKGLLQEAWINDVRPSTILHFLFSFAPNLLSSPHHSKRMSAEAFVGNLVRFDGSVDDGEASAWMTTSACCDAYQQRESVEHAGDGSGDRRVAAVLMTLGPELIRRRRH